MRTQDENKKKAIFDATIKLVNEVGFAAASVAKIAKEANVSPATLYIYYKNKEDLLVSIFAEIQKQKSSVAMKGFDESCCLKETLRKVWKNSFQFVLKNKSLLQYHDQFLNSPYIALLDDPHNEDDFHAVLSAIESAVEQEIVKPVDFTLIRVFVFVPLMALANAQGGNFKMTRKNVEDAFEMAWDAIRLD